MKIIKIVTGNEWIHQLILGNIYTKHSVHVHQYMYTRYKGREMRKDDKLIYKGFSTTLGFSIDHT